MKPFIVMQTDFGKGIATCTMDGVIVGVDPELRAYDSNHDIRPFDTYEASFSLFYVVNFWPAGTVFVSVVDPGVGTSRRACVAKLKNGSYVVTPDNGSLTHMKEQIGIVEVREIDETRHRLPGTGKVNIFHGRDLFAYTAAKLAAGIITYEEVGAPYPVEEIIVHKSLPVERKDGVISGMLETADRHFGLICTNIPCEVFEQEGIEYGQFLKTTVRHGDKVVYSGVIPYAKSFGYVAPGEVLAMISETQQIQISKNMGNLSEEYNLGTGSEWPISFEKVPAPAGKE